MPTLEAESGLKLEVTAVSPSSGRSKKLEHGELRRLLALLTDYEGALSQAGVPAGADSSGRDALGRAARGFADFGLDVGWFAEKPREDQPLFVVRFGAFEKPGYRLKDLLGIARDAGLLSAAPRTPDADAPASRRPADKRIFIVDDDESLLDLLARVVEEDGFQVETFADGVAMLGELKTRTPDRLPDLLLLDLMLPLKGGYEILQQLQMDETRRIPVFVITGRRIDHDMSRQLRQEPNLHKVIQKPIPSNVLLSAIHGTLRTVPPAKAGVPASSGFGRSA